MGGLVCCSVSSERKDDHAPFHPYSKPSYSNASPGRHSSDSDAIWEMSNDLVMPHEVDIKFVIFSLTLLNCM